MKSLVKVALLVYERGTIFYGRYNIGVTVTFLSKMVYTCKRVRVWTLGGASPDKTLLSASPQKYLIQWHVIPAEHLRRELPVCKRPVTSCSLSIWLAVTFGSWSKNLKKDSSICIIVPGSKELKNKHLTHLISYMEWYSVLTFQTP